MSAGFGFSVGDFIAAVNLLRKVGVALKDNGGARDDYSKTISKLEITKSILSCIANFKDSDKNLATVHAIHSLASLIQNDVERFFSKIENYQSTLGSINAKRFGYGTLAKVKWSQCVAGEVRRLYQDLDSKTASLGLLFDLHLSNKTSKGCEDVASAREAILHAIDDHAASSKTQVRLSSVNAVVKQDIDVLATGLQGLAVSHAKAANDMLSSMATKDDIRDLKLLLESKSHSDTSSQRYPPLSPDTSRLRLVLTIPQLHLPFKEAASILQNFSAEVTVILKIFLASFLVCFRNLLLALPQLILLYRVLRCLPRAISLVLHDNIAFEDALGRVQSLQFQQFRHWDVFETSLRRTFELVPGKQKVVSGNYVLTSPKHKGQLTSRNWSAVVRPGFVVKMAINLMQIFVEGRQCPRGCGSATSKVTPTDYCCETCGLLFAVRKKSDKANPEKAVGDGDLEMNVGGAWIEGRNSSERHQTSDVLQHNLLPRPKGLILSDETEELKAFKRIQLAETPQRPKATQLPAVHAPAPTQQHQMDTSGQTAPPGPKPKVTATLWEDEGTLCFQVEARQVCVARREDNHFINGTKLLNVTGMSRGRRDGILKSEKVRHVVKIGPMHLKGVWIPFERALDFANKEKITDLLYPLFIHNIGGLLYNPDNINRTGQVLTDQNFLNDMNLRRNQPKIATDDNMESWLDGTQLLQPPTTGGFTAYNPPEPVSGQSALVDGEFRQAEIHSSLAARYSNLSLQDYQMQLMLLEQQNKKRLMMARQEQDFFHQFQDGVAPISTTPFMNKRGAVKQE